MKTQITELFAVKYPIVAAPMFLVSNEEMVVATSEAGGIGTFPALNYRPTENLEAAIKRMRSRTRKPIGMNIIVQKSNRHQDAHIELALKYEIDLIITSLGSPKNVLSRVKGTNTKVFCDVIGKDHAKKVADLGADGLIAVAGGAGGHAGTISPFALIPYLKKEVGLPLIAAGSIVDGRTMLAAMVLGADAVYMGTRMIATKESPATQDYKQAILSGKPEDIVSTDRVDGFAGNFILTPELKKFGVESGAVETVLKQSDRFARGLALYRAAKALFGTGEKGSYSKFFSAGHGVGAIKDLPNIEELINRTMSEFQELRRALASPSEH
ncbi:MAG: hypothetical protein COT74_09785 [Bdellovibrionales bacterium CG10_big_fil_rev_8_21_14_0_10_45_34]|nr:MAG: hypothetical protein COT74_09785 [Bdellovibrionales bacterium CG10_big_fil_rev_8_21_14_0_10_45_34]